ncbi:gephyrin-like molybdotransferase Glp [Anaerosolibacter sp.]|uniref:molybdopterin molybdotransferase MoeA n=1 Tax=Anaerosolibacter sp. TaxID=1872527 RepID=UPI0039F058D7
MELLKVDTVEQVVQKLEEYFTDLTLEGQRIHITEALGRIIYEDIEAPMALPEFRRSTVDGYAVLAKDTFGASEGLPTFLNNIGKVEMGMSTELTVRSGECAYVPTGGMVPHGADAMVMIEHAECLDELTLAVYQSVAPGESVMQIGEDMQVGEILFKKGRKIKAQDIGALAALGIEHINVFQRPKVAVLSTGDEIVDPFAKVELGQIRDINTYGLSAMMEEFGGDIVHRQVIQDEYSLLKEKAAETLEHCDILIISGGSSVGTKDVTAKVINDLGTPGVFVHGIAIKPGKPTIIGKAKGKAVFGLPGHPVSAMIVCKVFLGYLLNRLLYQGLGVNDGMYATAAANIHSSPGKETYQMVVLESDNGEYLAKPIHGKSGSITLLTKADGYIRIDTNKEGVEKGEKVKVVLF